MKIVAHRGAITDRHSENTLSSLVAALELGWSIETDIRLHRGEIVLSHDPVRAGDCPATLNELIAASEKPAHSRQILFLNVKEDGLLPYLLGAPRWQRREVVFFDMSVPELVRYARELPARNLATRWSDVETEPVLYDRCDWLWIDCFSSEIDFARPESRRRLVEKNAVFVSPTLHGRSDRQMLAGLARLEQELNRDFAVCQDVFA